MNGRMAKKLRKIVRKSDRTYIKYLKGKSFFYRLAITWWLLFGRGKE